MSFLSIRLRKDGPRRAISASNSSFGITTPGHPLDPQILERREMSQSVEHKFQFRAFRNAQVLERSHELQLWHQH
ncbi:hypothetical protein Scep_030642 [Stephania cephalantha]|uniref:Uncharacterized protein n=1 Tax=Stephania cephalantha TaxID=152367 RepID=A0AAP0E060_9MAGN